MLTTFRKIIKEHITVNSVKYFFLLLSLITGITAGALFVTSLPPEKSQELMAFIENFCKNSAEGKISSLNVFKISLLQNIRTSVLIFICCFSIYLTPIMFLNIGTCGFVTGFTMGFLTLKYSIKGFSLAAVQIIPQCLIWLPAVLLMSVLSLNRAISLRHRNNQKIPIKRFTYSFLIIFIILIIESVIDAFVVPEFIKGISVWLIN